MYASRQRSLRLAAAGTPANDRSVAQVVLRFALLTTRLNPMRRANPPRGVGELGR